MYVNSSKKTELEGQSKEGGVPEDKINIADTSQICDMIWLVGDLYNAEKHLAYTVMRVQKTDKEKAKKLLLINNDTRINRSKIVADILKLCNFKTMGDSWCCAKHLIGALMQTSEVGIREVYKNNMDEALKYYKMGNDIWEALWALIELGKVKK